MKLRTIKKKLSDFNAFLHRWLGLISGLVVFILGITGCIYVLEPDIKNVAYRDRLFIQPSEGTPLSLTELTRIAQDTMGDIPLVSIQANTAPNRTFRANAMLFNPAGTHYFNTIQVYYTVYIHPYSGKIVYIENTKHEFFNIILYLHYNLMLGMVGKYIVGWSTVIFIALLLSGLVLWWPWNKHMRKRSFRFGWKKTTGWKRKNYDLHNVLGFYSLIVCLILAATGLVYTFSWFNQGYHRALTGNALLTGSRPVSDTTVNITSPEAPLDRLWNRLQLEYPDLSSVFFLLPTAAQGTYIAYIDYLEGNKYKEKRYHFDQYTLQELPFADHFAKRYEDLSVREKIYRQNRNIHIGAIYGLPTKIIAFIASLIAASLPITGFLIWYNRKWGKKKKSRDNEQRTRTKERRN
ncbi:PepSY-associated TM helix domain-containing protein [Parapedobacter koreensis]|uniref:Uncharacterized iron-regulated membrane protein n=1 Tax=Parapedobacter koreensis TaxID=332977 RepID=A0A1H7JUK3_9SPHI|nr:PepSY-associated TM helix domain-containing protein [Parapedobacter koreensis]SEK78298.1 Uncharacterized iron-regulated membrane protein [Parapedobacter koreensis]